MAILNNYQKETKLISVTFENEALCAREDTTYNISKYWTDAQIDTFLLNEADDIMSSYIEDEEYLSNTNITWHYVYDN